MVVEHEEGQYLEISRQVNETISDYTKENPN